MAFSTAASTLRESWDKLNEKDRFLMADNVAKSAERIKNLAMHLIAATKLDQGLPAMNLQDVKLSELINDFIDEASTLYTKEKNISLKLDLPRDYLIYADPESITQVLRNLITNAIKWSPRNSSILISIANTGSRQVEIKVTDSGVGIPPDELEAIFAPFTQSTRTNTGAGGVGLGLDIARKIIEAHRGKIWATNNAGKGATFCFTLPYVASETQPGNALGKSLLIIDDEEFLLESMVMSLSSLGMKVFKATNAQAGIALLATKHKRIDAVVLDVMMPGMNGLEALKLIKARHPKIKVIMHSGVATSTEKDESLKLGAFAFLAKPYSIHQLIELL
jgi:CheY-like chemotaxis protein/two-component sensor histidine kinase